MFTVGVAASLSFSTVASAGLMGQTVDLNLLADDNPFNGGYEMLLGDVLVTNEVEWSNSGEVYNYDDPDNPVYVGWSEMSIDIGDNWIDFTFRASINYGPGVDWAVFYTLPNAGFNGVEIISQVGDLGIASASASHFGTLTSGHIAQWDLWEDVDPSFNDWVNSTAQDPLDPNRLGLADPTMLRWNLQGIAWEYTPDGSIISSGIRVDLAFVPAPGALGLLAFAGIGMGRRRR